MKKILLQANSYKPELSFYNISWKLSQNKIEQNNIIWESAVVRFYTYFEGRAESICRWTRYKTGREKSRINWINWSATKNLEKTLIEIGLSGNSKSSVWIC